MTTVLRSLDGTTIRLDLDRWRAEPDPAELRLLCALPAPVLDVGCGPGRVPAALAAHGQLALGIDPAPAAVAEARRRGAPVLQRSVFDHVPGEGRWGATVLLDGNIGIGGDPATLLARCTELTRPGGVVLAEVAAPGGRTSALTVRVETPDHAGPWFPWAVVGADDWPALAQGVGLLDDGVARIGTRWFARGVRP